MLHVGGINVYPSSIAAVLNRSAPEATGEFQVVLAGPGPYDHLDITVEHGGAAVPADTDTDGLCDTDGIDLCVDADLDGVGTGISANADCVVTLVDSDDTDPTLCGDAEPDGCEDCTTGVWDGATDGLDTDGDGLCDLGDLDDDGDRFPGTRCWIEPPCTHRSHRVSIETLIDALRHAHGSDPDGRDRGRAGGQGTLPGDEAELPVCSGS